MAITLTSDVALSRLMNWLPAGGMMPRMAWGRITRPKAWRRVKPMAFAASRWPSSTPVRPARTISDR
jgi:hypothetical protein